MKKILYIVAAAFVAVLAFNNVSNQETKIIEAIEAADTETLVNFFSEEVELDIPTFDDFADKGQAQIELQKFFSKNPPVKFIVKHRGTSKGGKSRYTIGDLSTKSKMFRINFFIADDVIQSFSIHPIPHILS